MNERIKELARIAEVEVQKTLADRWSKVGRAEFMYIYNQKFAKLIIQECAEICRKGINNATDWDSSYWDQACENRAETIRQHFGVTE